MKEDNKNKINRRDFFKLAGAGTLASAAALYGCSGNKNNGESESAALGEISTDKMTYRTNPNTGDRVSLLGYGCMRWPTRKRADGNGDEIDQEAVNDLIDYAIAHGVNYFDTSPAYVQGLSERATGIALKRHPREKFFLATKLSNFSPSTHSRESWNKVVAIDEAKPGQQIGDRIPGVDKQMDEFAGYVDFRQDINSWLSLDAGVRIDHHSHVGTEWIPQGGLAFHLPRQAELKAMVSKGFRNPTIREMYMFPPQNPDLKAESLMNYELSFTGQLLGGPMSYGVNLYYINGDNIIMTDPALRKNVNSGEIENWGVETNLGYRINRHWQMNANYSWLHMENPVLAAPEHKLYAGADFTQGRWGLSTGIQYVKGLHTSVTPGKEKQESFVLWNLRANYRLCSFADVFVKGENLLAQRYEINAGFPMPKATVMGGVNINF